MIQLHVNVVQTIEYDKVIDFKDLAELKRFLVKINYKDANGEYDPTKVKEAAGLNAQNCALKVDQVGEVYVLTPSGQDVEVYTFLKVREGAPV